MRIVGWIIAVWVLLACVITIVDLAKESARPMTYVPAFAGLVASCFVIKKYLLTKR